MGRKKLRKRLKQAGYQNGMQGWPAGLEAMLAGGRRSGLAALRPREQFIVGALIGAAGAYVLGDEKLRAKLIKGGLRLYSELAGGFAEMKEQVADIRAEMAAGETGEA